MGFLQNQRFMLSFEAGANLTTKQFHFVKQNTSDGKIVACDTAGELALGILQNKPNNGETAQVVLLGGGSRVVAGAAINSHGAELATDDDGRAVDAVATNYVNAISDATASGDGSIIDSSIVKYKI